MPDEHDNLVQLPSSYKLERRGLGYRMTAPPRVTIDLDSVSRSRGEVAGELTVRCGLYTRNDGHLFSGRFNVSSLTARNTMTKHLAGRTSADWGIDWPDIMEQFCVGVLRSTRAGRPTENIKLTDDLPTDPGYLLSPLMPLGVPTLLYAPGGSGKSIFAAALALMIVTGIEVVPGFKALTAPVMVWDWEASRQEWQRRLARLANGCGVSGLGAVTYREGGGQPLADQVEEVAAEISDRSIGCVIVDSVGMAMGTGREYGDANESAIRMFQALRELGTTTLLIDHVTGADLKNGSAVKAYGSVYKINLSRSVWELRQRKATNERVEFTLRHVKVNNGPLQKPLGLALCYDEPPYSGPIRLEAIEPDQAATSGQKPPTTAELVVRLLADSGGMTAPELVKALASTGTSSAAVKMALTRGGKAGKLVNDEGRWSLADAE